MNTKVQPLNNDDLFKQKLNTISNNHNYDFKMEFKQYFEDKNIVFDDSLSDLEKNVIYRLHGGAKDCDCCALAKYIYKHLWNFDINNFRYIGETMTSFWTPFKKYLIFNEQLPKKGGIKTFGPIILKNKDIIESSLSRNAQKYLNLSYTLGNFIPVPEHFNVERSGLFARWDSWDLTMLAIYNWYKDNNLIIKTNLTTVNKTNDSALEMLFEKKCKNDKLIRSIGNCKEWLLIFGSWNNFVEQNYLQDFVHSENQTFGEPIMFFDGHSFYKKPLPTTTSEFEDFFSNSSKAIELRGKRMCKELNKY